MKIHQLQGGSVGGVLGTLQAMPDTVATGVEEASDLALLPDGSFITISDTQKELSITDRDGETTVYELDGIKGKTTGFEAVTFDPERQHYLVVSEDKAKMYRYDSNLELLDKIDIDIDGSDNKGVEGMTYLPANGSPTGKPMLLLAKEGKPKELHLLDPSGDGKLQQLELDSALKGALGDFSGLAYDPVSKHVFVASEESAMLAEVEITGSKARLISTHPLVDASGNALERVEGIACDKDGVYALTENDGLIHRYSR